MVVPGGTGPRLVSGVVGRRPRERAQIAPENYQDIYKKVKRYEDLELLKAEGAITFFSPDDQQR